MGGNREPQRFHRLDVVRVAPKVVHQRILKDGEYSEGTLETEASFEDGKEAIIEGSAADLCGGRDNSYSVKFVEDGNTLAWVDQYRLTFVRKATEEEVQAIDAAREARIIQQSDLDWILANWTTFSDCNVPGPCLATLAKLIGINNPWGRAGEEITLYEVYRFIYDQFNGLLREGNKQAVLDHAAKLAAAPNVRDYIRRYGC
jgi:hypothetical protein